mgnify:CR=1 FL=1
MNLSFEYVKNLIDISAKKYELLEKILALTNRQREMLEQKDMESTKQLALEKQNIIGNIEMLDENFGKIFVNMKQEMGIQSFEQLHCQGREDLKLLQDIVRKIVLISDNIAGIEEKNSKMASDLQNELDVKFKNLNQKKKLLAAYRSKPAQGSSGKIDRKK